MKRLWVVVPAAAVALLAFTLVAWGAPKENPLDTILALLTGTAEDLDEVKEHVIEIEETLSPASFKLSTGLFGLPANAAAVDWVILNNAPTSQTFTVTVYQAAPGGKVLGPPGRSITHTIGPGESYHNANGAGPGQPFHIGGYYEVVVETSHPDMLPTVVVWDTSVARVIPGTSIPPSAWVRLD